MNAIHRATLVALTAGALAFSSLAPVMAAPSVTPGKPAQARASTSAPTSIGAFKSWTAWTGNDANGLICYISAEPTTSLPDGAKRDPVHFLVVNRKALGTKNEVQTLIGYPLKKDSKPTATVEGKTYPMLADGNGAWLASAADEPGFVAALKKGTTLVVKGTSQRGTDTTDTYSLAGISAATAAIDKACN